MEDAKPGCRNSLSVKEEAGFNLFNTLELWKDIRYPNVSCDDHFPLSDAARGGREGDTTRSSHMCCEGAEGGNTCQDCRDGNTPVGHSLVNKAGFAFPPALVRGEGRAATAPRSHHGHAHTAGWSLPGAGGRGVLCRPAEAADAQGNHFRNQSTLPDAPCLHGHSSGHAGAPGVSPSAPRSPARGSRADRRPGRLPRPAAEHKNPARCGAACSVLVTNDTSASSSRGHPLKCENLASFPSGAAVASRRQHPSATRDEESRSTHLLPSSVLPFFPPSNKGTGWRPAPGGSVGPFPLPFCTGWLSALPQSWRHQVAPAARGEASHQVSTATASSPLPFCLLHGT